MEAGGLGRNAVGGYVYNNKGLVLLKHPLCSKVSHQGSLTVL